jgi:hypothetical protein
MNIVRCLPLTLRDIYPVVHPLWMDQSIVVGTYSQYTRIPTHVSIKGLYWAHALNTRRYALMNNVPGSTGLASWEKDCNKPILTTPEYIGHTHSIQNDTSIMNKVSDGTGLASQVYDCNDLILTTSKCIVS